MEFFEIVINAIISLIGGIIGGSLTTTIIIKKRKQINKNNSVGIQFGDNYESRK